MIDLESLLMQFRISENELHVHAIYQGHRMASLSCPRGDDRDLRSDIAELTSRAFDAIVAMVRARDHEMGRHVTDVRAKDPEGCLQELYDRINGLKT